MKTVLLAGAALLALASAPAWAQGPVSGTLTAAPTGQALPGATIVITDLPGLGATTDAAGRFELPAVPAGPHTLRISYVGFETLSQPLQGQPEAQSLPPLALQTARNLTPDAVVTATRATEKTGTAYQNVSREQLQARNFGQDLPYLLDQTPSVVTTSDAGTGVGYTGLRIRGTDGTRINVTLNGVPVNEAESHGVFFVDLPDLASSVQSIQVQRGAGPSTNGAGAFGASLNVETLGLRSKAYGEINNSAGSFGTWKTTVAAGTGLLGGPNGHFAVDARASRIQSDGYIDRASARLKSLYLTGTYSDEKTLLRALVLTGYETTYQGWYGLADSLLHKNRRYNEAGTDYGQHLPAYKNQTDNYQQDYYQFLMSRQLSSSLNLSVTPFWTRGGGYYEEYKANQEFAKYGIAGPVYQPVGGVGNGFDTLTTTDVIRRRWLKTDLYGATYALQYTPSTQSLIRSFTVGGAAVGYRGQHFDELTWAQRGGSIPESDSRYAQEPNARKLDLNTYARATLALNEQLSAFGDLQYRYVNYELLAPNGDGTKSQQAIMFHFFNPKAGLTYQLRAGLAAYASYALAQREPTRTDYTDTPAARRPTAEKLHNVEAGLRRTTGPLQWSANYYYMRYRDQLVLSGQLDDVGNPIHANVRDSYRTGLELQLAARIANKLTLSPTATLSRNKINDYADYLADYDQGGEQVTRYRQTDISFSPRLTFAYTVEYEPLPGLKLATLARYASRQYLDNTSTTARSIPSYYVQDVRLRYLWRPQKLGLNEVELAVLLNNVFATEYVNNGYTYGYVSGGREQYFNYFYPQAKRNFLASVNLRF